jgi:hypothetical protein
VKKFFHELLTQKNQKNRENLLKNGLYFFFVRGEQPQGAAGTEEGTGPKI